ncbi:efflux pump [Xylaria grammica]|nr:efflux pump [Xylaria grammica]
MEHDEQPNNDEGPDAYLSGLRLWAVLVVVTLASFIMFLDVTIISTAIPYITDEFRSLPDIGWYGSAYTLASSALQPASGKLYSHFNLRWTFLSFVAVLEVGSLVCGLARSSTAFIVGRAVAGLGAAGMLNGALTIIAASTPLNKRSTLTGIVIGVAYTGSVAAPVFGGLLTQYRSWRWCFLINLPIGGLVFLVLFFISIPEISKKHTTLSSLPSMFSKLDIAGLFLLAPVIVMVLLALHYGGNQHPWNSSVIGLLIGGAATFALFILWEYRKGMDAMIPLEFLANRVIYSSAGATGFMTAALVVHSYYLPIYFQAIRHATPTLSGVYILPSVLSQLVFSSVGGPLVSRIEYLLPFMLLSSIVLSVSGGLLSLFGPHTPTSKWVGYQILLGFGRGVGIQMPTLAVQAILPPQDVPVGLSIILFSQTFLSSIFLTVANAVFRDVLAARLSGEIPEEVAYGIVHSGVTDIWSTVPKQYVDEVLGAYSKSISAVFYLSAALGVVYFVFSWGIGRTKIESKEQVTSEDTTT